MNFLFQFTFMIILPALSCFGKRVPVPLQYQLHNAKLKESCPDECIYIKECGNITYETSETAAYNRNRTDPKSYVANGAGFCFGSYGLDTKVCPIGSDHECIMKCGGTICAFYDVIIKEGPIRPSLMKVYQILNDSSIDIFDSKKLAWYNDYIAKHNLSRIFVVSD